MRVAERTWKGQLQKKPPARLLPLRRPPPAIARAGAAPHPPPHVLPPYGPPGPHPQYLTYLPQSGAPPPMGYSPMVGPPPNYGPPLSSESSHNASLRFEKGPYPPHPHPYPYYPPMYPPPPPVGESELRGHPPWLSHDSAQPRFPGPVERSVNPRVQAMTPVATSRRRSTGKNEAVATSAKRITPVSSALKAPPPSLKTPGAPKPAAPAVAQEPLPKRPLRHMMASLPRVKKPKTEVRTEVVFPFFGPGLPLVSTRTAMTVFSYLPDDERLRASLVSKHWKFAARRTKNSSRSIPRKA